LPFSHSVVKDELAIAEPQPNVCEERARVNKRTELEIFRAKGRTTWADLTRV
jgi:hypothetical protein